MRMTDRDFEDAQDWFLEGARGAADPEHKAGLRLALAFMRGQRAAAAARDEELSEWRTEEGLRARKLSDAEERAKCLEAALKQLVDAAKYAAPEVLRERIELAEKALEQEIPF